jgi:uncharacterized membrane protein
VNLDFVGVAASNRGPRVLRLLLKNRQLQYVASIACKRVYSNAKVLAAEIPYPQG